MTFIFFSKTSVTRNSIPINVNSRWLRKDAIYIFKKWGLSMYVCMYVWMYVCMNVLCMYNLNCALPTLHKLCSTSYTHVMRVVNIVFQVANSGGVRTL